jgi:hypothetical protein
MFIYINFANQNILAGVGLIISDKILLLHHVRAKEI